MKLAFFPLAFLATSIASAATPIDSWYGSVFGGYASLHNNLDKTTSSGLTLTDANLNSGYNAGASFGYKNTPMRYEAQFTYITAKPSGFHIDGTRQKGVDGFDTAYLGMANVYFDFPAIVDSLEPFLGVGFGYGYIDGQYKSHGPNGFTRFNGSDSTFGYQGTAGLTFNFSEYCAVNINYRYVATTKIDAFGKNFQAQLANAEAVYRFDENQYK